MAEEKNDNKGETGQSDAVCKDQIEDLEKSAKNSTELKKTWGFRRTTIAKRDMAGETAGITESPGAPVRRSGRQAKRTDKLEEFLVTVKRGRGAARRSAPAHLESGDPPSETASEASFDGNAELKVTESKTSPARRTRGRGRGRVTPKPKADMAGSASDDDSSENEERVTKTTQEKLEIETGAEDAMTEEVIKELKPEESEKQDEETNKEEVSANTRHSRSPLKSGPKREAKPKAGACKEKDEEEEDEESSSSSESDNDGYDPNALYCICRQKHNKRLVLCI